MSTDHAAMHDPPISLVLLGGLKPQPPSRLVLPGRAQR